jgi:hypothetical protein
MFERFLRITSYFERDTGIDTFCKLALIDKILIVNNVNTSNAEPESIANKLPIRIIDFL